MSAWQYQFLRANAGLADSGWVDTSALAAPFSIIFSGTGASDTCDVRVSNNPNQPNESGIGAIYGAAIATDATIVKVTEPYRYVMVRRLTAGSAVVNAYAFGNTPPAR